MKNNKERSNVSRRDFLKATGAVAGTVGVASVVKATPVLAEEKYSGIVDFAVKEVDEYPGNCYPYADSDKLERFPEFLNGFNSTELVKQEFSEVGHWFPATLMNADQKIMSNEPGSSRVDFALMNAAWSPQYVGTRSWEPVGAADLRRVEALGKFDEGEDKNKQYVKKAAYFFGAGDVGVAKVNEKWFYSHTGMGKPITFYDNLDLPIETEEEVKIPKRLENVIVILVPMEGSMMGYAPSALGNAAVTRGYGDMSDQLLRVSEFIRELGYTAMPMANEIALSIPMAIDAGLGELGRHGVIINPMYGSAFRLCKILTDMPLSADKPINFGAAEFCRTCMKCAEMCPSQSISYDKDPTYEVKCGSNNPGMKKWYLNAWTCLKYWAEIGAGCTICAGVCTYTKPQTWIHDVVKGISSVTPVFNGTFTKLDNALGYGKTLEDQDPIAWWNKEGKPEEWPSGK